VRKVVAVIRREFVERVRTKWFWIGTILGPVFFGGMILLQLLLASRRGGERWVAVVDGTTTGAGGRLVEGLSTVIRRFHFTRIQDSPGVPDSLTRAVVAKGLHGFLVISDSTLEAGKAEYRGSNVSSMTDMRELEAALSRQVFAIRLERQGIDPAIVREAEIRLQLATLKITDKKVTGESGEEAFSLAFGMAIVLFMAILLYGINVMSSVLEEKTTRIVEVLVSSLRPFELMLGKVIGAGAVGIVQLTVWLLSVKFLAAQQGRLAAFAGLDQSGGAGFHLPRVPVGTLVVFITYFLLGYFLYAAIFAAVGAMSGNEQEARQAQMPVSLLLIVPYISIFGILNDPNSSFATWLTFIPFWSPIAVPVRWAAAPIPVTDLVGSLAVLGVSVVGVTWLAARVYRVGILMTGKRPSLREIFRWVTTT